MLCCFLFSNFALCVNAILLAQKKKKNVANSRLGAAVNALLLCSVPLSLFYLIVSLFMEMLVLSVHCDIFSCLYMQIKLQDFYLSDRDLRFYSLLSGHRSLAGILPTTVICLNE